MDIPDLTTLWYKSPDGMIYCSHEMKIMAINPAAEYMLGQSASVMLGGNLRNHLPSSTLIKAISDGRKTCEDTFSINEKQFRWCTLPMNTENDKSGTLVIMHDISEFEQLSDRLIDTEKLKNILTAVLDSAYEGIVIVDENGYITMFNQAYANFLGLKAEEMIGRPVDEVLENTRLHIAVKTGKAEFRQVQRIKGHDMICDRIPIREGQRIIGAVGKVLFRDISEIDELQEQTRRLKLELEYYKGKLRRHEQQALYSLDNIIGESKSIQKLKEMVVKVAGSKSTVLIRGESGTGKELFAHAIHNASAFYNGPFVKVNCAAIPENLLESELFGYDEGAFTGAKKGGKIGKFEQANGGSIFLDEIGDMPLNMQVKLLRVLQEKEVERVGGTRTIKVNPRVIAATNTNLEYSVREGKFRQDLFYRLNVVSLEIPPLRQRPEDISVLVEYFMDKLGRILGCGSKKISSEVRQVFLRHSWPGNIRELENVIERALNMVEGEKVLVEHLPFYLGENQTSEFAIPLLKEAVAKTECELLKKSLVATKGNYVNAAHLLGLSKSTFYEKVARYGLR